MRFDMVAKPVYTAVADAVTAMLFEAGVDAYLVDEIVYVGGTTCLPGLDECVVSQCLFREDVDTPFSMGTVVGGGVGDPTTVLARGCAVQAALLASLGEEDEGLGLKKAYGRHGEGVNGVTVTSRTLGIVVPSGEVGEDGIGGTWVPVVLKETALPARRVVRFDVSVTESVKTAVFEVGGC